MQEALGINKSFMGYEDLTVNFAAQEL